MEPVNGLNIDNSFAEFNRTAEQVNTPNLLYDTLTYLPSCCLTTIGSFTGTLSSIPSNCVSIFYDLFVDGNKPWKQVKYLLSLNAIVTAFENNHQPLHELKKTFSQNEDTPVKRIILSIIDLLLNINDVSIANPRENYVRFIDLLREALACKAQDIEYTPFLETVCLYRFTEHHPFLFCEDIINHVIKEGIRVVHHSNPEKIDEECSKQLHEIPLNEQFFYINAAPQNEKAPTSHLMVNLFKGGCNVYFDPQRGNNIPYVLFDFALNGNMVRVIRSGTPTMQRNDYASCNYEGKATITPEFNGLNEGLATNDKQLLYISLQNNEERLLASEKARNGALIESQKNLVILAHDSSFYHQKDTLENMEAKIFKKKFLDEMGSESFFFSEDLKDFEAFNEIINEVHDDLYLNEEFLTKKERLDFIEFTYARLTLHFLKKTKANYLVNICKDSIDRAGIRNALLHFLLLIFYQKEKSPSHLKELYIFLHAGPFLIKKRAVNFRQERLLSVLQLLESDTIRERILKRKDELGIQGDDLEIKTIPFPQNIT